MDKYYYLNSNNEQFGVITPIENALYGVTETTMVGTQGMPEWRRADQISEPSFFSCSTPPAPPLYSPPQPSNSLFIKIRKISEHVY
jgi:hypothetical protein